MSLEQAQTEYIRKSDDQYARLLALCDQQKKLIDDQSKKIDELLAMLASRP